MWGAIKSAASAIYNKIVPQKQPAAVKPGVVTTFKNPNLGQLGPTYNPQGTAYSPQTGARNPQSTVNPQKTAYNPQNAIQVADAVRQANETAVRQAAAVQARKAAAVNAFNVQKSNVLSVLKSRAASLPKKMWHAPKNVLINKINDYNGALKDPSRIKLTAAQQKALTPQHPTDPVSASVERAARLSMWNQAQEGNQFFNETTNNYRRTPLSLLGWMPSNTAKPQPQLGHNGFLNAVKSIVGAPKKAVDGVFNDYYAMKGKQKEADSALTAQADGMAWMNGRKRQADATVAAAGKQLANGVISVDQYNAIVLSERNKIVKQAGGFNSDMRSRQESINQPLQGKTAETLRKASTFFDPIGKVTASAFGVLNKVVEAPTRAMNTAWNLTHPDRSLEKSGFNYQKPPTYSEWVKTHGGKSDQKQVNAWQTYVKTNVAAQEAAQAKVHYKGNFLDRVKQAWGASKDQRVLRQDPYNKVMSGAGNLLADPINYLPNEWGLKAASWTGKLASKIPGADRVIGASSKVKDAFGATPVGRTAAWLNKPMNTGNNKYLQKYLDRANAEFKGLTPAEVQAYQDVMKNQGKLPTGYKMIGDGDISKVLKLTDAHTADYQKLYQAEKAAGLNYRPSKGYLPTRRELKDQASFLGLEKEAAPFFTRSKKFDTTYFTPDELAHARGYRGYASAKVRGSLPNQKFLSSDVSGLKRAVGAPNRLWKKAVLRYNPAWYVHNLGWNVPASFMAGGSRTAGAYAKLGRAALKERTLNPSIIDSLPEGAVDKGWFAADHGGKAGKLTLGTKIENFSRAAGFMGAKGQGKTDAEAIKAVDRTMFDYGNTKNWERGPLSVFPFWRFQKNITRLTAGMPFTHPRWAKAFNEIKKSTMDKPYANLPDAPTQQYNPETGQPENVNLKERYKGKMKTPWGWTTNPFLPILPQNLAQVGTSPWLSLTKRASTGKDYFGNNVQGESFKDFAGSIIPQYRVGKAGVDLFNGNGDNVEKWLSDSGYSKEAQGIDPTKPNYKASLDPVNGIKKALRSFTGIPNFTPDINWDKYRQDQNYYAFTKLYFGTDWYKQYPDYDKREAARQEMAKRFGMDLQKDLYDGRWSKYDSADTTKLKERKKAAIALQDSVYKMYEQIPAGKGNNGARGKFIQMWKEIMGNTDFLDKNPDFMVFKNVPISGDKANAGSKYAPSTKFAAGGKTDGNFTTSSTTSASKSFWAKYYSLPKADRKAYLDSHPQYKHFSSSSSSKTYDPKIADMNWAYKNLPPDVRRAYLNKKYGKTSVPAEGWDKYLADRGMDFNSKFGRDLIIHPEIGTKQLENVNNIVKSYAKPIPERGRVTWATPKRKRSYASFAKTH